MTPPFSGMPSSILQKFMNMDEEMRLEVAGKMRKQQTENIMLLVAEINAVNESMHEGEQKRVAIMGTMIGIFVGVNELPMGQIYMFNGPDLYVYLSTNKDISDIVNLGRLKGNIGNQNYPIPTGTDISKYNTVLIWCHAYSVLFGSAFLASP
jgi:Electron transfer DM13